MRAASRGRGPCCALSLGCRSFWLCRRPLSTKKRTEQHSPGATCSLACGCSCRSDHIRCGANQPSASACMRKVSSEAVPAVMPASGWHQGSRSFTQQTGLLSICTWLFDDSSRSITYVSCACFNSSLTLDCTSAPQSLALPPSGLVPTGYHCAPRTATLQARRWISHGRSSLPAPRLT